MPAHRTYRLQHCLGRGGFGEVYLAVMETGAVRAEVAVKLLNEGRDPDDQALERLRDEGRLLGLLNHPVILKVHDLLVLDGRVALVTEYVDGADLEQCFASGGVPIRALVEIVGRVADALGVAWTAPSPTGGPLHLVHRDVKPANIRIGRHGDVKLLDFGIARASDLQREAKTRTDSIFGTFPYMAPERFDDGIPVGPAGDVFALGAVLYEGLTGKRLVYGLSTKETYVLAMEPDDHRAFVADRLNELPAIPAPLRELLTASLSYDPADRPNAAEVASCCEQLVDGLPGSALRRYCRERAWSDVRPMPGPMDGRVLTAHTDPPLEVLDQTLFERRAPRRWPWLIVGVIGTGAALAGIAALVVGVVILGFVRPEPELPAPVRVAQPEPEPEPQPVPDPVPAPAPVPPPPKPRPEVPPMATFTVEGGVPVELRADGRRLGPGPVPAGSWEIWADFGEGPAPIGHTSVPTTGSFVIRCNKLRDNCIGAP